MQKKAGTAYILVTMNGMDKAKVCRVVVQDGTAVKPTPAPTKTPEEGSSIAAGEDRNYPSGKCPL